MVLYEARVRREGETVAVVASDQAIRGAAFALAPWHDAHFVA